MQKEKLQQRLDSVFVKEKTGAKYIHFHPETRTYKLLQGKVGACLFKSDIVDQFIVQVLGSPNLYETESLHEAVVVKKDTEQAAYADLRARGYQG